jgi:hypothetical protein
MERQPKANPKVWKILMWVWAAIFGGADGVANEIIIQLGRGPTSFCARWVLAGFFKLLLEQPGIIRLTAADFQSSVTF